MVKKIKNQCQEHFKTKAKQKKKRVKKGRTGSKDKKDIARTKIHKILNKTSRAASK